MGNWEMFPKQVWEMLLDKIENPNDKLAVIWAYPKLEEVFHTQKHEWQFNAILPIVFANLNPPAGAQLSTEQNLLLKQAFFACRLVSSATSKVLDNYIEAHCKIHRGFPPFYVGKGLDFTATSKISLMLEKIKSHPEGRSSILSRCLNLSLLNTDTDFSDLFTPLRKNGAFPIETMLRNFFQKEGSHLITMDLKLCKIPQLETDGLWTCKMTEEILRNVQNLRFLVFTWANTKEAIPSRNYLTFRTLPCLPSLISLCLTLESPDCRTIFEALQFDQYFPQLKTLFIKGFSMGRKRYTRNRTQLFPNLERLFLIDVPILSGEEEDHFFRLIELVLKTAGKLQEICIYKPVIFDPSASESKKAEAICKALKLLKATIRDYDVGTEAYRWKCISLDKDLSSIKIVRDYEQQENYFVNQFQDCILKTMKINGSSTLWKAVCHQTSLQLRDFSEELILNCVQCFFSLFEKSKPIWEF